ncbi:FAR1-related sequence 5-like protein [Tanacetum coccineum]
MTQAEKIFVVKAATNKIGATHAHNLLSSMKGGYEYVHGTTDDFKNYQRDVNVFIGESDAQMLINKMENRMMYVPNFTFQYKAFKTAFIKEPTMIVTDQDGAMKRAIEAVFTKSKHRLCMWHITQKIPAKRLHNIVWNMFMEPLKFEEQWAKLIEDFGLQNHKWMKKMFNLREMWIPAYFIDSPLFGLMRTTSRSESENSFFKSFTSPGSTLVNFMMSYELAIERQRYRQEALDFKTLDAAPKCETNRDIDVIPKQYILRRWTRDIIPPDLRRQRNRYGEKMKQLKDLQTREMKADMPNPPSRNTGDVIGDIFAISKPNQVDVQNQTKARNKGEHLKKEERLKSEREKALKVIAKPMKVCGYCNEKTNEHTKTTCPKNPKARRKKATPIIDV